MGPDKESLHLLPDPQSIRLHNRRDDRHGTAATRTPMERGHPIRQPILPYRAMEIHTILLISIQARRLVLIRTGRILLWLEPLCLGIRLLMRLDMLSTRNLRHLLSTINSIRTKGLAIRINQHILPNRRPNHHSKEGMATLHQHLGIFRSLFDCVRLLLTISQC
jgi:hypothetical protein